MTDEMGHQRGLYLIIGPIIGPIIVSDYVLLGQCAEQKLQKAFSGIMHVFWGLGVLFKKGQLKVPALVLHRCAHL